MTYSQLISPLIRFSFAFISVFLITPAFAQNDTLQEYSTPEITVLGQGGREKKSIQDYLPTVTEISGRQLERKKDATLGETLSQEAGVTSSFFGPNSSRPIIRGLDGERVRILQNGMSTLDASGSSPDHAIPIDPFLTERVEIVRGSAALLYGNTAIGGVVNTVTQRIPSRLSLDPTLKINTRFSSNDWGRAAGLIYQRSSGPWVIHLDGVVRKNNNYQIPGYARSERLRLLAPLPLSDEMKNHVENSQIETLDGAIGGSYVTERGYLGVSLAGFGSDYGTVAEPDVRIGLQRQRIDLAGEIRSWGNWIRSAQYKGAISHYKHVESHHHEGDGHGHSDDEDAEIGTVFRNQGFENRIDIKHHPIGILDGMIGFQHQYSRFAAQGEEAFLPTTQNLSLAAFTYQEIPLGNWTPSFGARLDRSSIMSVFDDHFGESAQKSFWSPSASAGLLYTWTPEWSLGLHESFTSRAPNYQEIFADGVHMATGIYEKGDRDLKNEKALSHELSLRKKTRSGSGRASVFLQDYSRFISLNPSAEIDPESELPIYTYSAIAAQIYGAEIEYRQEIPWRIVGGFVELSGKIDWLQGRDLTHATHLPRMTPMRESFGVHYRWAALLTEFELQRSEFQGRVASNEIPTDAYTQVNWGAEMPLTTPIGIFHFSARVNNVFDVEARNHVSLLKDRAPLPGRNFIFSLQAQI